MSYIVSKPGISQLETELYKLSADLHELLAVTDAEQLRVAVQDRFEPQLRKLSQGEENETVLPALENLTISFVQLINEPVRAADRKGNNVMALKKLQGRLIEIATYLLGMLGSGRSSNGAITLGIGMLACFELFSSEFFGRLCTFYLKELLPLTDTMFPEIKVNPILSPLIIHLVGLSSSEPSSIKDSSEELSASRIKDTLKTLWESSWHSSVFAAYLEIIAIGDPFLRQSTVSHLVTFLQDGGAVQHEASQSEQARVWLAPAVAVMLQSSDPSTFRCGLQILNSSDPSNLVGDHAKVVIAGGLLTIARVEKQLGRRRMSTSSHGSVAGTSDLSSSNSDLKSGKSSTLSTLAKHGTGKKSALSASEDDYSSVMTTSELDLTSDQLQDLFSWLKKAREIHEAAFLEVLSPDVDFLAAGLWAQRDSAIKISEPWNYATAIRTLRQVTLSNVMGKGTSTAITNWLQFLSDKLKLSTEESLFAPVNSVDTSDQPTRRIVLGVTSPFLVNNVFVDGLQGIFRENSEIGSDSDVSVWRQFRQSAMAKVDGMRRVIEWCMCLCHFGIQIPGPIIKEIASRLTPNHPISHGVRLMEIMCWHILWDINIPELDVNLLHDIIAYIHSNSQNARGNNAEHEIMERRLLIKMTVMVALSVYGVKISELEKQHIFNFQTQFLNGSKKQIIVRSESADNMVQSVTFSLPGSFQTLAYTNNEAVSIVQIELEKTSSFVQIMLYYLNVKDDYITNTIFQSFLVLFRRDRPLLSNREEFISDMANSITLSVWANLSPQFPMLTHASSALFIHLLQSDNAIVVEFIRKQCWTEWQPSWLIRADAMGRLYSMFSNITPELVSNFVANSEAESSLGSLAPIFSYLIDAATEDSEAFVRSKAQYLLDSFNPSKLQQIAKIYQEAFLAADYERRTRCGAAIVKLIHTFPTLQVMPWDDLFAFIAEAADKVLMDVVDRSDASSLADTKSRTGTNESRVNLNLKERRRSSFRGAEPSEMTSLAEEAITTWGPGEFVSTYFNPDRPDMTDYAHHAVECIAVLLNISLQMLANRVPIEDAQLNVFKIILTKLLGYVNSKKTGYLEMKHGEFLIDFEQQAQAASIQLIWLDSILQPLQVVLDRVTIPNPDKRPSPDKMLIPADIPGPAENLHALAVKTGGLENNRASTFVTLVLEIITRKNMRSLDQPRTHSIIKLFFDCVYKYKIDYDVLRDRMSCFLDVFDVFSEENKRLVIFVFGAILDKFPVDAGEPVSRLSTLSLSNLKRRRGDHVVLAMLGTIIGTIGRAITRERIERRDLTSLKAAGLLRQIFEKFSSQQGIFIQLLKFSVNPAEENLSYSAATLLRRRANHNKKTMKSEIDVSVILESMFAMPDHLKNVDTDPELIENHYQLSLLPVQDILHHLCNRYSSSVASSSRHLDKTSFTLVLVNLARYVREVYKGPVTEELVTDVVNFWNNLKPLTESWRRKEWLIAPVVDLVSIIEERRIKKSKVLLVVAKEIVRHALNGPEIPLDYLIKLNLAFSGIPFSSASEQAAPTSKIELGLNASGGVGGGGTNSNTPSATNVSQLPRLMPLMRMKSIGSASKVTDKPAGVTPPGSSTSLNSNGGVMVGGATVAAGAPSANAAPPPASVTPTFLIHLIEVTRMALKAAPRRRMHNLDLSLTLSHICKLIVLDEFNDEERVSIAAEEISPLAHKHFGHAKFNSVSNASVLFDEGLEFLWESEPTFKDSKTAQSESADAFQVGKWLSMLLVEIWEKKGEKATEAIFELGSTRTKTPADASTSQKRGFRLLSWLLYACLLRPRLQTPAFAIVHHPKELADAVISALKVNHGAEGIYRATAIIKAWTFLLHKCNDNGVKDSNDTTFVELSVWTMIWPALHARMNTRRGLNDEPNDTDEIKTLSRDSFIDIVQVLMQCHSPVIPFYAAEFKMTLVVLRDGETRNEHARKLVDELDKMMAKPTSDAKIIASIGKDVFKAVRNQSHSAALPLPTVPVSQGNGKPNNDEYEMDNFNADSS